METQFSYKAVLEKSHRVNWRVDDLIGGEKRLDFTKPFLPETYTRAQALPFLNERERLTLNHIRAHDYAALFELVETFILPFVGAQAAKASSDDDGYRNSALANFAAEETKHMALFGAFRRALADELGEVCGVIGPPEAISEAILAHSPLSVAVLVLSFEWMSQGHYVESVKDDAGLDPVFKDMLKHHWVEEVQHAKLDGALLATLANGLSAEGVDAAVTEYLEMVAFFDGGLKAQAGLDLQALERCIDRTLSEAERVQFVKRQHEALCWTFLGSSAGNRNFQAAIGALGEAPRRRIEAAAAAYC